MSAVFGRGCTPTLRSPSPPGKRRMPGPEKNGLTRRARSTRSAQRHTECAKMGRFPVLFPLLLVTQEPGLTEVAMARRPMRHEPAWNVGNGRGMEVRQDAHPRFLGGMQIAQWSSESAQEQVVRITRCAIFRIIGPGKTCGKCSSGGVARGHPDRYECTTNREKRSGSLAITSAVRLKREKPRDESRGFPNQSTLRAYQPCRGAPPPPPPPPRPPRPPRRRRWLVPPTPAISRPCCGPRPSLRAGWPEPPSVRVRRSSLSRCR
jgi:hypothetical protein